MEDQNESGAGSHDGQQTPSPLIIPEGGAAPARQPVCERPNQAKQADDQLDRDLVKWTGGLARWTKALAIFTAILVIAAGLHFWVMRGQLEEMKTARESGDISTADQLGVMRKQAEAMQGQFNAMQAASAQTERAIAATNRLAEEAGKTATASKILADEATRSANATSAANDLTRKLADAAIKGNGINQQALVGVQRAFMFPTGVELSKVTDFAVTRDLTGTKPVGWLANVQWENSGNTPTRDLKIKVYCLSSSEPLDEPYNLSKLKDLIPTPKNPRVLSNPHAAQILYATEERLVFGPKQTGRGGLCSVNALNVLAGAMGLLHLYIFGEATYRDVLDDRTDHRTDFCYEVNLTGNPETGFFDVQGIEGLKAAPTRCKGHNCADDECPKQDRSRPSPLTK